MTASGNFRFLCPSAHLDQDRLREATLEQDGRTLYLIVGRHNGQVRGWLNVCPHQGRNLNFAPDRFLRDDAGRLVCAAHGAVFELEGGECVSGPCRGARLTPVHLTELDGAIYLRIQDNSLPLPRQ